MRLFGAILPVFSISAISGADTMTRSAGLPEAMASRKLAGRSDGEIEFDAGLLGIVVDHAADDAADGAGGDDVDLGRAGWRGCQSTVAATAAARSAGA